MSLDPSSTPLPTFIDHLAHSKPNAIYAEYPRSPTSYSHGFVQVTFRDYANVINGLAWWLIRTLGPGNGTEILPYIGLNDLRYPGLIVAAVKAGYTVFCTSPRNSPAAHASLFQVVGSKRMLVTAPRPPFVIAIVENNGVNAYEVPSMEELLERTYPHFEFGRSIDELARETFVVLHTSGSTGIPKTIFWIHDYMQKHMAMLLLDPPEGGENRCSWTREKRMFVALPPFHAGGVAILITCALALEFTSILPTSVGLPTAEGLVDAMKQTPINAAFVPPSLLKDLSQAPELLNYCSKHLNFIFYGGGDLPQAVGDIIAPRIRLVNQYGASEQGFPTQIHYPDHDLVTDWSYVKFHPSLGVEYRAVTETEYELVWVRTAERDSHTPVFSLRMFPEATEYYTKDLWIRHPDPKRTDLWRYSSRTDDVIVSLNGEKTNPVSMEQHVGSSSANVTGVLVAGAQRFQAALLVELIKPPLSENDRAAAVEKIWPSVEEANAQCFAHARVQKSHILFTNPDKPMLRAGKGTIQRTGTLASYAEELNALYVSAEATARVHGEYPAGPGDVDDLGVIAGYIRQALITVTGWKIELGETDNLFHLGLDSLQAMTAVRVLAQGLDVPQVAVSIIYQHPSISELTRAILRCHNGQKSIDTAAEIDLQERDTLLRHLKDRIHVPQVQPNLSNATLNSPTTERHTVLLTGSTGTLGTYLLSTLLQTPSIRHIHCLNRSPSDIVLATQQEKSKLYSLTTPLPSPRVSFWHSDLSTPDLGLAPATLAKLRSETTLIIHNAWPVNFNLSLQSFQPSLQGVVNLINFALAASKFPRLFFISSISSVASAHSDSIVLPNPIPETMLQIPTAAATGYANSKYIAEHLLSHAALIQSQSGNSHSSFAIARVGQIAGAVHAPGLWPRSEWFPSLVLSSAYLGVLPEDLAAEGTERVDWVPVDALAGVLVELALSRHSYSHDEMERERERENGRKDTVEVYHPLNLSPVSWESIRSILADVLSKSANGESKNREIAIVPLRDWIQLVREDLENTDDGCELEIKLKRNPAAKLLDFFAGLAADAEKGSVSRSVFDTRLTAVQSGKLRAVSGIQGEWVRKWVGEWTDG
ncbi:acetyl-CoA synthetase-like protein [Aspergillus karnatakaensis]|uniref:acetyl-CoA synthetase-like protein n=1 Tax=Aspergillus karnatakaensis TaxID=1810916 RepID=UPI003CCDD2A1